MYQFFKGIIIMLDMYAKFFDNLFPMIDKTIDKIFNMFEKIFWTSIIYLFFGIWAFSMLWCVGAIVNMIIGIFS